MLFMLQVPEPARKVAVPQLVPDGATTSMVCEQPADVSNPGGSTAYPVPSCTMCKRAFGRACSHAGAVETEVARLSIWPTQLPPVPPLEIIWMNSPESTRGTRTNPRPGDSPDAWNTGPAAPCSSSQMPATVFTP